MSNHDHWLEHQGGCYDQIPSCQKCGYELCEHGLCRYCAGCSPCEAEDEAEHVNRKLPQSIPAQAAQRKTG